MMWILAFKIFKQAFDIRAGLTIPLGETGRVLKVLVLPKYINSESSAAV
jgi:hypothetical protein